MNPDDPTPTSPSSAAVLVDALLDGEAVDKASLRLALEDAATRDYLVDALVLRQLTREMAPMTWAAPSTSRPGPRAVWRWIASAAVLALVAAGGYFAGHQHDVPPSSSDTAPAATAAPALAPAPTKIIRFEPGVSWTTETVRQ